MPNKKLTITFSEKHIEMAEEIKKESGALSVPDVLRDCLEEVHFTKYVKGKYKRVGNKEVLESDPYDNLPFPDLCESLGGTIKGGICKVFIAYKRGEGVPLGSGHSIEMTLEQLRNNYKKWKENGRSWEGVFI